MFYPQPPEDSTPTRLDAFQGAQAPSSAPLNTTLVQPSMYSIPGLSRPTFAPLPNAPSFLGRYGADDVYSVPNHQGQNTVYPPVNFVPPTFPIYSGDVQQSYYPFPDILGKSTIPFLPSEDIGRQEQLAQLMFQWPVPMQPEQALDQVAQDIFAAMELPQELVSVHHMENYQTNVAFDTTLSAPEVYLQGDQLENQSGSHLSEEDKVSEDGLQVHLRTREQQQNDERYYCELCDKWVLVRRRKFHHEKHAPVEYVCKICDVLGMWSEPLSRKDALKRHIKKKHPEYFALLENLAFKILQPRRKNETEDLVN